MTRANLRESRWLFEGKGPRAGAPRTGGERRNRTVYSKEQVEFLAKAFKIQPYPGYEARELLARETGIPEPRIHVWFQNRRARQLKPVRGAGVGQRKALMNCRLPGQVRQRVHLTEVPAPSCLDNPDLPGGTWSHLGHPQPLGQHEEDPCLASQRSLLTTRHTSPFLQERDSGIPLGSGNLPSLPHQNQQCCYGDNEYAQWTLQNPQLGGHACYPPHHPHNETAMHFCRGPDQVGSLYPTGGAMSEVPISQSCNNPGLYGDGESWENWG